MRHNFRSNLIKHDMRVELRETRIGFESSKLRLNEFENDQMTSCAFRAEIFAPPAVCSARLALPVKHFAEKTARLRGPQGCKAARLAKL